jgi:hypothetical protein
MTDADKINVLVEALRDLKLGASIMLEIPASDALSKYAREVERVAASALEQVRQK